MDAALSFSVLSTFGIEPGLFIVTLDSMPRNGQNWQKYGVQKLCLVFEQHCWSGVFQGRYQDMFSFLMDECEFTSEQVVRILKSGHGSQVSIN